MEPCLAFATEQSAFEKDYKNRIEHLMESIDQGYRPAELQPVEALNTKAWTDAVSNAVTKMHHRHSVNIDGLNVSIGLVRCANINPAVELSRYLANNISNTRVCCYHGHHTLIQRYHIESNLDVLLRRQNDDEWIQKLRHLPAYQEAMKLGQKDLLLVVVASPVEEIGRDHDFDYAVIEPSSSQSIVQTAGRVNRHRMEKVSEPNIAILQYAYRYCRNQNLSLIHI